MKVPEQPEVNIGLVGHVDHGKSTLAKLLTGEYTDRHSEEIKRGISIRLGYADAAFYKCPECEEPQCYGTSPKCPACGSKAEFMRAVSFVDSPGHETLMATMLSGAAIMDGALLLIAANEKCPQPQTKEHLMALSIIGVDKIVVVQNKIDLVDEGEARKNYEDIRAFLKGTVAENAPIVPISAHHNINADYLIMEIERQIPTRKFEEGKPPRIYIARSFDVNTPGTGPEKLTGGVIGGSLLQGRIGKGDEIEIRPGRQLEISGKSHWEEITTHVVSLHAGRKPRKEVRPGGLIAIGTKLDPSMTKSDAMVGRVAGTPGTLPSVVERLTMETKLLERVVGTEKELKVEEIRTNEPLMLSVGTATTVGIVTSAREDLADLTLKIPVAVEAGQRAAISRRIGGRWRLIGYGVVQ
ncbi:MAG: translation initiation factor IF-2 subunit gamma [Thermoplasmata archaeon]